MPCYFFNLRREHLSVRDAQGEECANPVEAVERARVAICTLMNERALRGSWSGWAVDVEDETRNQVATVPFAFAGHADQTHRRSNRA
jgi:3-hydroxyisobutyrate dehydrogenase-like beta-hydroxyacid dehydrogenase